MIKCCSCRRARVGNDFKGIIGFYLLNSSPFHVNCHTTGSPPLIFKLLPQKESTRLQQGAWRWASKCNCTQLENLPQVKPNPFYKDHVLSEQGPAPERFTTCSRRLLSPSGGRRHSRSGGHGVQAWLSQHCCTRVQRACAPPPKARKAQDTQH